MHPPACTGTHYSSSDQPKLAKWSKLLNCPPDECCEATKWGGLVSVKVRSPPRCVWPDVWEGRREEATKSLHGS